MAKLAHAMSKSRNRSHIPLIGQLRTLDRKLPLKLSVPPPAFLLGSKRAMQCYDMIISRAVRNLTPLLLRLPRLLNDQTADFFLDSRCNPIRDTELRSCNELRFLRCDQQS